MVDRSRTVAGLLANLSLFLWMIWASVGSGVDVKELFFLKIATPAVVGR